MLLLGEQRNKNSMKSFEDLDIFLNPIEDDSAVIMRKRKQPTESDYDSSLTPDEVLNGVCRRNTQHYNLDFVQVPWGKPKHSIGSG